MSYEMHESVSTHNSSARSNCLVAWLLLEQCLARRSVAAVQAIQSTAETGGPLRRPAIRSSNLASWCISKGYTYQCVDEKVHSYVD